MAKKTVASFVNKNKKFTKLIKFVKTDKGFYSTSTEMVSEDELSKKL